MSVALANWVAIGVGGALGSVARYGLSLWVYGWAGRNFPYGTLVVNVVGCLAMGILFVWLSERGEGNSVVRAGLLVGVLGGFTTFSSFSMETVGLIEEGEMAKALLNSVGSVVACVGATWLGVILARQW